MEGHLASPEGPQGKRHGGKKGDIFPDRQAEQVTDYLCQRSHGSQALIVDHPFIRFGSHPRCGLSGPQDKENESLKEQKGDNGHSMGVTDGQFRLVNPKLPNDKE